MAPPWWRPVGCWSTRACWPCSPPSTLGMVQAGLDPWLAAAIVGAAVLIIGAVVVSIGLKAIRESNVAPTQTAETVRENVAYIKEHVG